MLFDILKKDIKRNKTMNIILFLFVIIASIFFASGFSNLIAVLNGTDYMFEKAEVGDYQIATVGENVIGSLDEDLDSIDSIDSYKKDTVIFLMNGELMRSDDEKIDFSNTGLLQSIDRTGIKLFDKDNNVITGVNKGEVWVTSSFLRTHDLSVGDTIKIEKDDIHKSFKIVGGIKDAFLGSEFMNNGRYIMNDDDFSEFYNNENSFRYSGGEIFYINSDNVKDVDSKVSKLNNVNYAYPTSNIKLAYVMNLIVAFVVVILSLCLILVSALVLRFSINFSISEDFREIGVMKAIGIKNTKIRLLYLVKYVFVALIGSVIGLFISFPFGKMLLDMVTEDMILGSDNVVLSNACGALAVLVLVSLSAYISTKKVKKLSPVDAVREGQTGERYKKRNGIKPSKSLLRPTHYLSLNDVLSSPKRFLTIIVTFSLCTLFVLVLVNTANTMNSDRLASSFGPVNDVYMSELSDAMSYKFEGKEALTKHLKDIEDEFIKEGMPCKVSETLTYTYGVEFNKDTYNYLLEQGINIKATDYNAIKGDLPKNKNEVCITKYFTELTGAKIGDTIRIDLGEGLENFLIVGEYQSMNQLGKVILIHEDVDTDFQHLSNPGHYRVKFTDSPDQKIIDERVEKIKEIRNNDKVYNCTDYCLNQIEVYPILDGVAKVLLIIVLFVVVLITVLMERSFIADEKNEIAIVKAIGFRDFTVIRWHVFRFFTVALIAMIIAVVLSVPVTDLTISPIFGMMGASNVEYNYDILRCFVTYPLIIMAVTVITATLTALYTRKIVSRDTASIE